MTDFSAAGPLLGYIYQVRLALALALEAPEYESIVVEGLDDIVLQGDDSPRVLLQTKHHSQTASLTDSSEDLWKTLRIWSTYITDGRLVLPGISLALLTTGSTSTGSIASLLRQGSGRDTGTALQKLRIVASVSENQGLRTAFKTFNELSELQQSALVEAISVLDSQVDAADVRKRLEHAARLAVRPEHRPGLIDRLEGWWFGRVVQALRGRDATPIPVSEVLARVHAIAEQFQPDALPIDFLNVTPTDPADHSTDRRQFISQLRLISAGSGRIERAILDYYQAFHQRSRWAREELLPHQELEDYETRLIDEWQRYCDALRDGENFDLDDDSDSVSFGKKVFAWMDTEADYRIRDGVRAPYVMRGSFHILADDSPARVWWHPHFLQRLAALSTDELKDAG